MGPQSIIIIVPVAASSGGRCFLKTSLGSPFIVRIGRPSAIGGYALVWRAELVKPPLKYISFRPKPAAGVCILLLQ